MKQAFVLSKAHIWTIGMTAFLYICGYFVSSYNDMLSAAFFLLWWAGLSLPFEKILLPIFGNHVGYIQGGYFSFMVPNAAGWTLIVIFDLLVVYLLVSFIKLIFHRKALSNV